MSQNFAATKNTAATKSARKGKGVKKNDAVIVQSLEAIAVEGDSQPAGDEFTRLLADLGGEPQSEVAAADTEVVVDAAPSAPAADDEMIDLDAMIAATVVEQPAEAAPVEVELSTEELESAVSRAEATDAMVAAATEDEVVEGATPSEPAPGEGTTEASSEAAAPKRTPTPRKHYADKVERLKDRVGADLVSYTVLTTDDALVDEEKLGEVMARTLDIIRGMNSKEKNRASNFIEFLSGKRASLNNVLQRVLAVLDRDGFITTGVEGNVIKDLLARPYSLASARAMGGNTIGMFTDLKVIVADGKGKFVANPDSLLLAKARSLLGAAKAAPADEGAGEPDAGTEAAPSGASDDELAAALEAAEA